MLEVGKMFKKKKYMEWDDYSKLINEIDNYMFSQKVRLNNIKNMPGLA